MTRAGGGRRFPPLYARVSLPFRVQLAVLGGAVIPVALIGLWLTRSAERAGTDLLHARLSASLARVATGARERWEYRRADLLLLAENAEVRRALAMSPPALDTALARYLRGAMAATDGGIERAVYRDARGNPVWLVAYNALDQVEAVRLDGGSALARPATPGFSVTLPIEGGALGAMEGWVPLYDLVPEAETQPLADGVLAVVEGSTGEPLSPVPFAPRLAAGGTFINEGERWLGVSTALQEPALELVIAAPLDPFVHPFERSARRGAIALLLVAAAGIVVATWVTRRADRSLERMVAAAESVSRGELDRTVQESGGGPELERLAQAFNTMTRSLRRTLEESARRQALGAVGEFASNLAHEVRNPLTSLRLDLQVTEEKLARGRPDPEALRHALATVERLERTVSGVLRVARSGRIERARVDLRDVIAGAAHAARPAFAERGARLDVAGTDRGPAWVLGDAAALEQMLLNLLLNAAQALPPGGIASVRLAGSDAGVVLDVADNGKGIAPDELPHVLQPFHSTRPGGTGLGLPIARQIALAHGGTLGIESEPGKGTRVRVELSRLPAESEG